MSTAAVGVLEQAARLGVTLRAEGSRIVARPKEAVTSDLKRAIVQHRAEILAVLAAAVPPPKTACWNCHGERYFARVEQLTWVCARCHPPADASVMVWHDVVAEVRDG